MSSHELDRYLAETRDFGRHESEGAFTLDATKATAKMAAVLESPSDYLAKVMQAALLCAAQT